MTRNQTVVNRVSRGFAYLEHGQNEKAVGDFSRAIEIDRNHAKAWPMRSRAYGSMGNDAEATEDRAKALETDPNVEQ